MSKKKMASKDINITAPTLRIILTVSFVLALVGSGLLVFYGNKILQTKATEANAVITQADTISQTNNRVDELWKELQSYQSVAEKADKIAADTTSYQYQDVIIKDMNLFAKKAGVQILSYDFSGAGSEATGASGATNGSSAATAAPTATTSSGLKTTSASVTIETPVDYEKLLIFLHYIEQNITRMQIANISLADADTDGSSPDVNTNALTVEVYIK